MLVGVPKEIKDNEYRVAIVPSTVRELADKGHRVVVESRAGAGAGFADSDYQAAGAEIGADSNAVFGRAELIVKVKEPLVAERPQPPLVGFLRRVREQNGELIRIKDGKPEMFANVYPGNCRQSAAREFADESET